MIYSHSSLWLFENDRRKFYLRYMAENKPPREDPNEAMLLGSSIDVRLKRELQKDLGLPIIEYPILPSEYLKSEHVMDVLKMCGEYEKLLDRLKLCLSTGGDILFEHKIERWVEDFKIIGYLDLGFRDSPTSSYNILDIKCTNWFSKGSPKPIYNRFSRVGKSTKYHKNFVNTGNDPWCGYGGSVSDYVDQLYLYWRLINNDNPLVTVKSKPTGGIIQIMPQGVAVSYGELKSDVFKRFKYMHQCVSSRHIFEGSKEENDKIMAMLEDPVMQSCL